MKRTRRYATSNRRTRRIDVDRRRTQMAEDRGVRRLGDRAGNDRCDERAQPGYVALSIRVNAICQKHYERFTRRIEPKAGAGEARMSERPHGKDIAAVRRERSI